MSEGYLSMLASCSGGISPVVCALFVSSGNITTATVTNTTLMLVYTLFQNGIRVFLWPVVQMAYVMGIVGNLGGSLRLDGISRFVRRLFTWLLSLVMLFLSVLIGVQSTMAVSADSFSMKTAKFALGNFIPLVGNALSDAVGTVAGSLSLIKNSCGVFGIVTVALLLLPVLLHLLLHRAVIGIVSHKKLVRHFFVLIRGIIVIFRLQLHIKSSVTGV
jgi:stage III sporulation protein AE